MIGAKRGPRNGDEITSLGIDVEYRDVEDAPTSPALLEVRDLCVQFSLAGRLGYAVNGLSYTVHRGQTLAIIGESGSGKTVSSRAVIGLLPPNAEVSGSVRFEGNELIGLSDRAMRRHLGRDFSMVFQNPDRSLNPTMRIGTQIVEAIRAHRPMRRREAHEEAVDLLGMVRLPSPRERYYDYPHQLSGGGKQRVMIAIALACRPKLVFADEATSGLDVTTQAQVMDLLLSLKDQLGMALVMISHDLGLAAAYADEVIVMYGGAAVEQTDTARLFGDMRMPYTRALMNSLPGVADAPHSLLPVVDGQPPGLLTLRRGCSFAPRCARRDELCDTVIPTLDEHEPGHRWACWHPYAKGEGG